MAWASWSRKAEAAPDSAAVAGLDLTSGRARAVYGPRAGGTPRFLPLDGTGYRSVAGDQPGKSGRRRRPSRAAINRRMPHLVCRDYLPALGQSREWRAGRHRLDPAGAIALLVQRLRQPLAGHRIVVAVPSYLAVSQVKLLTAAFENAKLPALGTAATPIALTGTIDEEFSTAIVADADDHALIWTVLAGGGEQVRVLANLTQPAAGIRSWLDRLLDAVSDRCIRLCRRDPRDSAAGEQGVYEQLDAALDHLPPGSPWYCRSARRSGIRNCVRTGRVGEILRAARRQAVDGMRQVLAQAHAAVPAMAPPDMLWVTADAARLPGLVTALTQHLPEHTAVRPLPPNAIATAAHAIAGRWLDGELPRGHLDSAISLNRRLRLSDGIAKPLAARPY